ncbi:hypothetical protein IQ07DRAFT_590707 [Pyrenochaeta sp. DS3sAY3a]|nr:hypothetical protein IQ07DRAFT_590707 [Pyrenochaeta sp. DS3sAY3a]
MVVDDQTVHSLHFRSSAGASHDIPDTTNGHGNDTPIPSYLAKHIGLGFNGDDIAALISSIDSSQVADTSNVLHLPAEILLHILEHVPVDYILDWRLICRGFRDAIDGRILYHHLRKTTLIGYMGPKHSLSHMRDLEDEEYEKIHLIRARYLRMSKRGTSHQPTLENQRSIWNEQYAIFQIDDEWSPAFLQIAGAADRPNPLFGHVDPKWHDILDKLELSKAEEGFGTLRWCIQLDQAVLDLDIGLELNRGNFYTRVFLQRGAVTVAWKDMLFRFLKTERALRLTMEEEQHSPTFTYSHTEDCLRKTRRQRLHAALDPTSKVDRHIKWSLRLLKPLFGTPRQDPRISLEDVENDATSLLMLLRREASMSTAYISYLRSLAAQYEAMSAEVHALNVTFQEFREHFTMPGIQYSLPFPVLREPRLDPNPVAWTDEVRGMVEEHVAKWKAQRSVIARVQALLGASNEALQVPENSFDDLESDF